MQTTIARALLEAAEILQNNQVNDARREAKLLLMFVLRQNQTYLIAHDDEFLSDEQRARFFALIKRRADGEPAQYIIGSQEFYGLDFAVNPNVLIPRPETEILVAAALEIMQPQTDQFFCDIGTGSGAIAVAIAKNLPNSKGVAVDISPQALSVARQNAINNQVEAQLKFIESNVFSNPSLTIHNSQFTIILSNPPYISSGDAPDLQREVRDFEPHNALFAGADGFDVIKKLLTDAPQFLIENGFLLFEIGFGQAARIVELIDENVWKVIEIRPDLQSIERVVVLQKK